MAGEHTYFIALGAKQRREGAVDYRNIIVRSASKIVVIRKLFAQII